MKNRIERVVGALLLSVGLSAAYAQAPAAAPAGSTGVCKDGTYSQAASKRGACAGHKGVKDWYTVDPTAAPAATKTTNAAPVPAPAAPVAKTAAAAAPAPTAAPAPVAPVAAAAPKTPMASTLPTVAAAGGGAGQVWVNTSSKVYHCEGSKYYGKTKAGSYMTESAAIAAGAHADHKKACKAA